jgi:hypothetical protein
VPAMDKSMTAAALVVCQASNLRTIANVCNTYAQDHKKWYPNSRPEKYSWDALFLQNRDFNFDLRPLFRPYIPLPDPLKIFADPLSGNIEFEDTHNRPGIDIYSNYLIFSGWGIAGAKVAADDYGGQIEAGLDGWRGWKKLNRMGDGFEFTETRGGTSVPYRFPILAADLDSSAYWGHWCISSHPDWTGKYSFTRWQNEIPTSQQNAFTPVLGGRYITLSWWEGAGHGADKVASYAYTDGSVARVDNLGHDDPRMAKVVITSLEEYRNIDRYMQLPKTR